MRVECVACSAVWYTGAGTSDQQVCLYTPDRQWSVDLLEVAAVNAWLIKDFVIRPAPAKRIARIV